MMRRPLKSCLFAGGLELYSSFLTSELRKNADREALKRARFHKHPVYIANGIRYKNVHLVGTYTVSIAISTLSLGISGDTSIVRNVCFLGNFRLLISSELLHRFE